MKRYTIRFTKQAVKDVETLSPKLKKKLKNILEEVISKNPYTGKKLLGELQGSYSYRLTFQDRIIYSIDRKKQIIYIERAKTLYGR